MSSTRRPSSGRRALERAFGFSKLKRMSHRPVHMNMRRRKAHPVAHQRAFARTAPLIKRPKVKAKISAVGAPHHSGQKSVAPEARGWAGPNTNAHWERARGWSTAGRANDASMPTTPVSARMLSRTHLQGADDEGGKEEMQWTVSRVLKKVALPGSCGHWPHHFKAIAIGGRATRSLQPARVFGFASARSSAVPAEEFINVVATAGEDGCCG